MAPRAWLSAAAASLREVHSGAGGLNNASGGIMSAGQRWQRARLAARTRAAVARGSALLRVAEGSAGAGTWRKRVYGEAALTV